MRAMKLDSRFRGNDGVGFRGNDGAGVCGATTAWSHDGVIPFPPFPPAYPHNERSSSLCYASSDPATLRTNGVIVPVPSFGK